MFQSIDIEGFRGFSKLELSDLGRVNLVVGKNNTGKTSLLEALTLIASPELIDKLPGLFRANPGFVDDRFYRWLPNDLANDAAAKLAGVTSGGILSRVVVRPTAASQPASVLDLERTWSGNTFCLWSTKTFPSLRVHAVSVQHRSPDAMVDAFAEAVRAPEDERQMEVLLASVDKRIRSLRLDAVASKPFIVVDVGLRERIPLSQAGQGIYRLVAIFSELLGRKPDICFIDEIENGIHYTALPTVWNGIAEIASRLNIQVFATTHSRECLVAAHECFAARKDYELRVVQLYRTGDTAEGRTLDRKHIEASIAGDIEVR